jgi:2-C-methyl-D-erythritol 4-phosphate cytidylyltransferase
MNHAVIVAAGSSARMGFDKITAPLAGMPVLAWSLHAMQTCPEIDKIVLVCASSCIAELSEIAAGYSKMDSIVPGGEERSASVLNGLLALQAAPNDIVAVHDAARPLVTPGIVSKTIAAAIQHGAASAAQPVSDSIHRSDSGGCLYETVSRAHLFAMQTPQAARFDLLISALKAHHAGATDEVSALIAAGIRPVPVLHGDANFKITYPQDLALAEKMLLSTRNAPVSQNFN